MKITGLNCVGHPEGILLKGIDAASDIGNYVDIGDELARIAALEAENAVLRTQKEFWEAAAMRRQEAVDALISQAAKCAVAEIDATRARNRKHMERLDKVLEEMGGV